MFFVYIARCANRGLYVGITNDVIQREKRHNAGQGGAFTRRHRPVRIVYTETYSTRIEAAQRERQLKGWTKTKKERLIQRRHPNPKK